MTVRDSRAEYEQRMHRLVEYIDTNFDQPLDLPALADVAHFSPLHFHRLFAPWMGETLGDYLRRRRVEVAAASLLSQPGLPVHIVEVTRDRFPEWRRMRAELYRGLDAEFHEKEMALISLPGGGVFSRDR